jgi:hypothetical protein
MEPAGGLSWNRLAGCQCCHGGGSYIGAVYFFLEMDQLWNNASSNKNKYIDIGVMNMALD